VTLEIAALKLCVIYDGEIKLR